MVVSTNCRQVHYLFACSDYPPSTNHNSCFLSLSTSHETTHLSPSPPLFSFTRCKSVFPPHEHPFQREVGHRTGFWIKRFPYPCVPQIIYKPWQGTLPDASPFFFKFDISHILWFSSYSAWWLGVYCLPRRLRNGSNDRPKLPPACVHTT
jgi:hypothetical protein